MAGLNTRERSLLIDRCFMLEDRLLNRRIKAGQHFMWSLPADSESGEAVVNSVRTDQQEGLSPEAEDYVALWVEATGLAGSREEQVFTILLATNGKSYLDGKELQISIKQAPA